MNVLFVCNQGQHRSKTAAEIFSENYQTKFAGIYTSLVQKHLEWADLIVVMEEHQRKFIADSFPNLYLKKQILCLDIPDVYSYGQPELVALLKDNKLTTTQTKLQV